MAHPLHQLEKSSKAVAITASLALVAIIGFVDYLTGFAIFFSAFYLLPVAIASWYVSEEDFAFWVKRGRMEVMIVA